MIPPRVAEPFGGRSVSVGRSGFAFFPRSSDEQADDSLPCPEELSSRECESSCSESGFLPGPSKAEVLLVQRGRVQDRGAAIFVFLAVLELQKPQAHKGSPSL